MVPDSLCLGIQMLLYLFVQALTCLALTSYQGSKDLSVFSVQIIPVSLLVYMGYISPNIFSPRGWSR